MHHIKTAILVDGGFYRRISQTLWGKKTAADRAAELHACCFKHRDATDSVLFDGRQDITGTLDPALDDFEKTRADLSGCTVTASASYSTFTGERLFDGDVSSSAGRWLAIPTVFGTMPDLTDGFSGTVAGSATHNTFTAAGAFDGDVTTGNGRWLASIQPGEVKAWVQWTFSDGPHAVGGYGFKNVVTGTADRAPRAWRVEGSNDGGATWTEVDSDSRAAAWGAGEKTLCEVDSPGPYSWYKLDVTGLGPDAGYVGFQEIELYGLLSDPTVIVVR